MLRLSRDQVRVLLRLRRWVLDFVRVMVGGAVDVRREWVRVGVTAPLVPGVFVAVGVLDSGGEFEEPERERSVWIARRKRSLRGMVRYGMVWCLFIMHDARIGFGN